MGIKKFMTSLNLLYNFVEQAPPQLHAEYLYMDFNSIIHDVTNGLQLEDEEKICSVIISRVLELLEQFDDSLKVVFISIDGIPSKAKWFEQRTRQFSSLLEKAIKREMESSGATAVGFHKGQIKPYTPFMRLLTSKLNRMQFREVRFIVNSYNHFGEGEFKILQHIRTHYDLIYNKHILIFSPDADMIINSILLQLPKLQMIRFLDGELVMYDIRKLKQSFMRDIESRLKLGARRVRGQDFRVFADIMFLFTFLGNDFLPSLVKGGHITILLLLTAYIKYLNNNPSYILDYEEERYSLNIGNLVKYWREYLGCNPGNVLFDIPKYTKRTKVEMSEKDRQLHNLLHISEKHFLANRGPFTSYKCPTKEEKMRQYIVGLHWIVEYYFNYILYNSWHYNCLDLRMDDISIRDVIAALQSFDSASVSFEQGVINKKEYLGYIFPKAEEFELIFAYNGLKLTDYSDSKKIALLANKIVNYYKKNNYNTNIAVLSDIVCLGYYLNSCIVR